MSERVDLLTPVGRLVQGSAFEFDDKNMKGQPLTDKHSNPRVEYYMALAIPKTDAGWPELWQKIQGVAQRAFPGGESQLTTFSWKYIDGDTTPDKESFKGCHVLKFKSGFAPKVYTKDGAALVVDPAQLKRGYYIRIYGSVTGNGQSGEDAGLYLNLNMVEIVAYGEEISGGPAGDAVFGAAPAAIPAGASLTPVAGAPIATGPPVAPGVVAPGVVAPVTTPIVQPAPDFLTPTPVQLTAKAVAEGQTHASLLAAGWDDAKSRANGYIV